MNLMLKNAASPLIAELTPSIQGKKVTGKKQILQEGKRIVASLPRFKSRCFVCRKKFGKYFVFHHIYYVEGEPYHAAFKDSTNYQLAVLPIIEANPIQFLLLCKAHHHFVEWAKSIKNEAMWRRFCKARKMS